MRKFKENILTKIPVVILLAFICSALWGSAFSGVKIGYEKFGIDSADWSSQVIFAGVRFAIAGIMALVFGSISARKALLPTRQSIPKIMIISLFQTILQYIFYYIGLAHTTGVKAAVIVAANVFMAILISSLIYKIERLALHKIIGCVLGFSGIIIINFSGLKVGLSFNLFGDGFVLISTVANGFSSVLMKKYSTGDNPVMLSGWQFFFWWTCYDADRSNWRRKYRQRKCRLCHDTSVSCIRLSGSVFTVVCTAEIQSCVKSSSIRVHESCVRCHYIRYCVGRKQFFWRSGICGTASCMCGNICCQ